MIWYLINGGDAEELGFIPTFVNENDERPACVQLDANYGYGGNWESKPHRVDRDGVLHYPGDEPLKPIAVTLLRDERIFVYPAGFVSVVQPDGSFVVQRMD